MPPSEIRDGTRNALTAVTFGVERVLQRSAARELPFAVPRKAKVWWAVGWRSQDLAGLSRLKLLASEGSCTSFASSSRLSRWRGMAFFGVFGLQNACHTLSQHRSAEGKAWSVERACPSLTGGGCCAAFVRSRMSSGSLRPPSASLSTGLLSQEEPGLATCSSLTRASDVSCSW